MTVNGDVVIAPASPIFPGARTEEHGIFDPFQLPVFETFTQLVKRKLRRSPIEATFTVKYLHNEAILPKML